MAVPVILVASILGNALIQIATKPWPWLLISGYILVAKFNIGNFSNEVVETVNRLWWVVVLILIVSLLKVIVPAYLSRTKSD